LQGHIRIEHIGHIHRLIEIAAGLFECFRNRPRIRHRIAEPQPAGGVAAFIGRRNHHPALVSRAGKGKMQVRPAAFFGLL
jgi:hypothetical protein